MAASIPTTRNRSLLRTRTLLPCRVHGLACNEDGALLAWGVDAVGVARGDAVATITTETRCVAAAFASSEEVATLTSAGAVERRDAATLARRGATAALQTSGELRCGALRVAGELVKACVAAATPSGASLSTASVATRRTGA